jgi:hypothetical protein
MNDHLLDDLANVNSQLMGFALAVKDCVDFDRPMPPEFILKTLVMYATEYETIKGKLNVHAN